MFFRRLVLFVGLAYGTLAGATVLFIEAEDFDNLPSAGEFMDVKPWYAKRHSFASGGAFAVAHYP